MKQKERPLHAVPNLEHHIHYQAPPPPAGNGWVFAGFIFGLLAWLIALATDKGDGRAKKAMRGCLIWVAIIAVIFIIGFAG